MSSGNPPGPIGASEAEYALDDGTLVLTASPAPAPLGQAKSVHAKDAAPTLGEAVLTFARGTVF